MIKNYFKIAWRNLVKNKVYSFINIGGLAVGMAVAILIGLWIYDELNYDKSFKNYDSIAQVMQSKTFNGETITGKKIPIPLGNELRLNYGDNFKHVLLSTVTKPLIFTFGDKKINETGVFIEENAPEVFSLKMLKGDWQGLKEPQSILLSESLAKSIFKDIDPIGKILNFNDSLNVKIMGVYEDFPFTSTLKDVGFMASWRFFIFFTEKTNKLLDNWDNNGWQLYVQIADNANMEAVSTKIKNIKQSKINQEIASYKPELFLHPMSNWHLYSEFKNGVNVGGRIQYVWMFGIIGLFVLILACINFMNLSTARSEKRAKETGIRKAIGSLRHQLISQFLTESVLVACLSLLVALFFVQIALPLFNTISDKKMVFPWLNSFFWLFVLGFTLFTGVLAGSYPAFYLSSFNPIKVLKSGGMRVGQMATLPRKVLVVVQFTVSIVLIISTIIVFRQLQFAQNRPVGYDREGLLTVELQTQEIYNHFESVRNDLLNSGVVLEAAESSSPTTEIRNSQSNFNWKGKNLSGTYNFSTVGISQYFGKTVNWEVKEGNDYTSGPSGADAMGLVINETAQKTMGLKNAVGEKIRWSDNDFTIIGVVKDMVMESPYEPANPTIFYMAPWFINVVTVKLKPNVGVKDALSKVEGVFKKYNPNESFEYQFSDEAYSKKFLDEKRVGNISIVFAVLAIFISCLGLFGLATFVAEQRTKEIGIRKVLGASVANLWQLLSKDFVVLVAISCLIASPIAYYFMHNWLQKYTYRTDISWWIFAVAGGGALLITLLTVSFQAIKAAVANPVKSLRTE
jgi:putative ABC transport system permease protein